MSLSGKDDYLKHPALGAELESWYEFLVPEMEEMTVLSKELAMGLGCL